MSIRPLEAELLQADGRPWRSEQSQFYERAYTQVTTNQQTVITEHLNLRYAISDALTVVLIKIQILSGVTLYRLVNIFTCWLNLQGLQQSNSSRTAIPWRWRQAAEKHGVDMA